MTAPVGGSVMVSKWLIQTGWCSGWAAPKSTSWPATSRSVRPYSPRPVRATVPPEVAGQQLGAVADAEDRHAEVVDTGVDGGRPVDVDRGRPAGEDDPGGASLGELGGGDRVGHDLAVDVGLADPTGDELGVLGAEVDDEDGVDLRVGH